MVWASKNKQAIGIMGGTFDPIHLGHLIAAEHVLDALKLDKILFIPTGDPPHKKDRSITSPSHRMEMVRLAVLSNPKFMFSSIEVDRGGNTYTIDTLIQLKKIYGDNAEYFFIVGTDSLCQLSSWKMPDELFKLCNIVAVNRGCYENIEFFHCKEQLEKVYRAQIHVVEIPAIEISSTQIRNYVSQNHSIKYLVNEEVEEYIYKNQLYRDGGICDRK